MKVNGFETALPLQYKCSALSNRATKPQTAEHWGHFLASPSMALCAKITKIIETAFVLWCKQRRYESGNDGQIE